MDLGSGAARWRHHPANPDEALDCFGLGQTLLIQIELLGVKFPGLLGIRVAQVREHVS
jgi:hypothetical protein